MEGMKKIGQVRIDRGFNPSNDPKIDEIKEKAGELLNLIDEVSVVGVKKDMVGEVCLLYTSPSPRD